MGAGCGDSAGPVTPSELASAGGRVALLSSGPQTAVADVPFRKILCFGDSITFGVTLEAPLSSGAQGDLAIVEGYVPKLWRQLESKYGSGFELINAGIGGERTTEGVERIRYELLVHDPDLVLLLEGVVDVNNPTPRFPVVRENLARMMELVLRDGKQVIIGTYPLLNPEGFRTTGYENVPRLNDVVRQEANRLGVVIADHEKATDVTVQGPDGLHPNNIGYEAIASTWLTAIETLSAKLGT
jgi:lysophospholipase L1-like esterase